MTTEDRISTLVHIHGTRLVRLAYLLEVPAPELAAADALATTVLRRSGADAHEELAAAAQEVGARAEPPVHDYSRLQGLLDRAQLDARQVDLIALQVAAACRLAVQRERRRRYRRRVAGAAVAAVALVAGATAVTGGGDDPGSPSPSLTTGATGGLRNAPESTVRAPVDLSGLLPSPPARLPPGLRSGTGAVIADAVLAGPSAAIARVHIDGAPATVVAVNCAPRNRPAALCVVALARGETLREAEPSSLLAVLPLPRGEGFTTPVPPAVSRSSIVDEFQLRTVLMEATSAKVGTVSVSFTTGQFSYAARFSEPQWDAALFIAVTGDETPAALTYLTDSMIVGRRVLYTATP